MSKGACTWRGGSGKQYVYERWDVDTNWNTVSANYICAAQGQDGKWYAQYIGETGNLAQRMANHEKWPCCRQHRVTEIHVNRDASTEQERKTQERDLLSNRNPPCND